MSSERYAVITTQALDDLRKTIGVEVPCKGQFNTYATADTIRHFAYGIGDTNPLWSDEDYARKSRYGSIVALPCYLFTGRGRQRRRGLPGVHAMWSGSEFEWFLPVRAGDRMDATVCLNALIEKESKFARRSVVQEDKHTFRNQHGQVMATIKDWAIRTERDTARETGKYSYLKPQNYTVDDIKAIEADYDREEIRGATPRYWEDVDAGDVLTHVVKGPLTVTDIIAFMIGYGDLPFTFAHRRALEFRRRHPGIVMHNSQGVPDVPEAVHWDNEFAQRAGVPAAFDFGPQRVAWLGHLMTNWIGDDAFLKKMRVEVRRFNLVGDTTWCKGKVTRKYVDGTEHVVDCDIWCEDQRGETTARGSAVVALPQRTT